MKPMRVHKMLASCLGIGFIRGGGTITAIVCCIAWSFLQKGNNGNNIMIVVTSLLTAVGVWSSMVVEKDWGKDSSRVVIDEAAGMCVSLLFVPVTAAYLVTALLLFRFFDIVKPLYIRKAESLPGGWGVMTDDVLSGIYSNIVLQVLIHFNVFNG
jgi:phosphatidylglycerophosphatase A